jgi:hypothetical protein
VNRQGLIAAALFVAVFAVYLLSPNATPFDSRWTVHTALSIIHERNADLNEYAPVLRKDHWYAIECFLPDGQRIYPVPPRGVCAGRAYHFYPIAVPLLVSPAVAALEWVLPAVRPLAGRVAPGPRRAFLSGDLAASSTLVELLLASLIVAAAAVIVFLFGSQLADWRAALLIALVFAFATSAWSTGSRALWMHGFSMVLLPAGLWAMWRGRWAAAGAVLVLAFFARPTNVAPLVFAGVWGLTQGRRAALHFALGAAPVALVFVGINEATYGTLMAPFFFGTRANTASLSLHSRLGEALLGNLISPSRGLFVYTPVAVFSLYGVWLWIRGGAERAVGVYLAAVFVAHYLLMSLYEDWFGGHSYGPRYFSDLSSLFALALLPIRGRIRWALGVAVLVGVFMHAQGALCWPCVDWNSKPVEIRESQWRLWDWSDPPFLRNVQPPPDRPVVK